METTPIACPVCRRYIHVDVHAGVHVDVHTGVHDQHGHVCRTCGIRVCDDVRCQHRHAKGCFDMPEHRIITIDWNNIYDGDNDNWSDDNDNMDVV